LHANAVVVRRYPISSFHPYGEHKVSYLRKIFSVDWIAGIALVAFTLAISAVISFSAYKMLQDWKIIAPCPFLNVCPGMLYFSL